MIDIAGIDSTNAVATPQSIKSTNNALWVALSDGGKATYSASYTGLVAVTGDAATITGSATKIIRVTRLSFRSVATAAADMVVQLILRGTTNTGGTFTSSTLVPHDPSDVAGTAAVRAYTVAPTINNTIGAIRTIRQFVNATGSLPQDYVFDFGNGPKRGIVLRGVNSVLAVNVTATLAGMLMDGDFEWTEE